ncbi:hypothetical protein ACFQO7_15470 [Catellatospora aurea]|uniref:Nickel/cobalt efflux system n=1 Tax=Catellatospora aurea TaxID=1337874 RepID=A0ABW2H0Q6_9ACTN
MAADPAQVARRRLRPGPVLAVVAGLAGVGLAAWWATGGAPGPAAGFADDGHDHGPLLGRLTAEFTGLVGRQELTPGFAALAMLVALALGAGHALAPGHGKLLMATYLVNERGSLRQAVSVAGTVALTHTAGVLVLGVVLALLGIGLLLTRLRDRWERAPRAWMAHRGWRLLPLVTSSAVILVGVGVATTALFA